MTSFRPTVGPSRARGFSRAEGAAMDAMFCGGKRRSDLAKLETDGREEPSFAREAGSFGSGHVLPRSVMRV